MTKVEISDKLQREYDRFVEFGQLLDRTGRKYLVQYLQNQLQPDRYVVPALKDTYFQYFRQSLDAIFGIQQLLDLCQRYPRITEQVVMDTLRWLRKTYAKVATKHPYQQEADLLGNYQITPLHVFYGRWSLLLNKLRGWYEPAQLDTSFYAKDFKTITQTEYQQLTGEQRERFELLYQDLLAQWDALLQAKILDYQLYHLQQEQEQYVDLLDAKVQEYSKLTELISPFSDYLGWDLSRELWEDTSFDLLQQYDELLQDEKGIRELADMLGQLREAELELEEETLNETIIRQEWQTDPDVPAEIRGVEESDNLSRLLSAEVSLLSDPATETLFLQKLVEKNLQTFRMEDHRLVPSDDQEMKVYQRIRQKEKGPFIICVDTSESMTGRPEQVAKILTLGILKMAMREQRRAYLINFSIGIKTLDLYDIANSLDELAAFLRMSFHGGTDISLPLFEAIRQLKSNNYQDADVLIVSDFIMYRVNKEVLQEVRHFQQNRGTQFHSLTLGKNANSDILNYFDTNWLYDPEQRGIARELAGVKAGLSR